MFVCLCVCVSYRYFMGHSWLEQTTLRYNAVYLCVGVWDITALCVFSQNTIAAATNDFGLRDGLRQEGHSVAMAVCTFHSQLVHLLLLSYSNSETPQPLLSCLGLLEKSKSDKLWLLNSEDWTHFKCRLRDQVSLCDFSSCYVCWVGEDAYPVGNVLVITNHDTQSRLSEAVQRAFVAEFPTNPKDSVVQVKCGFPKKRQIQRQSKWS